MTFAQEKKTTRQLTVLFIVTVVLCFWASIGRAAEPDYNKLVWAIGKAENSVKYPFGIKSIDTKGNVEYARKICLNTVKNNYKRWQRDGAKGDYLEFLAKRFCPVGASDDPKGLNRNWLSNVRHYYLN